MNLKENEVHIWWTTFDTYHKNLNHLDKVEQEKVTRLKFPKDQEHQAITYTFLRDVLAEYTGQRPEDIEISRDCLGCGAQHGKPALLNESQIKFNLSHTAHFVVVGVSNGELGIDIEEADEAKDVEFLYSALSQSEKEQVDPKEKTKGLLTYWTRKESIVKALGVGLTIDLQALVLSGCSEAPRIVAFPDGKLPNATMVDFELEDVMGCVTLLEAKEQPVNLIFRRHAAFCQS
ncbi:4'-phosphopantetheinyl transferase family protein [Rossellomorea marisflavi]|uniref:4'-phosphopantetheinyl transferase family protein n=1 Tax=Rossellomorea marisflavi TaxID=189381 RepID=UPI0006FC226F|nr:hypothetical protein ASG66_02990 [Bacillus sp. Leaf406]